MNKIKHLISFYLIRTGIVLFWIGAIGLFLYSPYVSRLFDSPDTINVYTWADIFDDSDVIQFEKQTGIRVNLVYYDNSEELITKLQITKGHGFDVIVFGDSCAPDLVKMGLLLPLDQDKLNFWSTLEPRLLNLEYDPYNRYAVPFSWDVYGLGIDQSQLLPVESGQGWKIIFTPQNSVNQIGMLEEGLRVISVAAQYLYGNVDVLDDSQLNSIKNLLIEQKKKVAVYTELLGDYLLYSKAAPVVVSQAAYVHRVMKNNSDIKFEIPQEGGFIAFENLGILKDTKKQAAAYQFINFMFTPEIVSRFAKKTSYLPTRRDVLSSLSLDYIDKKINILDADVFKKFGFFKYTVPREQISRVWIEVKAS